MTLEFWNDKRVLVTGATGFIGSWLVERLSNLGATITVFIKENDPIDLASLVEVKDKVKIFYGDIRESDTVYQALNNQEIIFHLAAITQVLYAIKNPAETVAVDVNGTLNILEAIRNNDIDPFLVFASTDKVYGEPKYLPIDEEHVLLAKSPYDASKLAADRLVSSYFNTYGIKSSIVRWSNTYGGRDSNILRAVPDFIMSILNNKPPIIRGNGKHIRDYMYVDDAISGILLIAEKQAKSNGEAFNIGTERPTSVLDLAKLITKLMKLEVKTSPIILNKPLYGEIEVQYLSYKKAYQVLGWEPKINLEDGLKDTIEWYKNNRHWLNVINKVSNFYGINSLK